MGELSLGVFLLAVGAAAPPLAGFTTELPAALEDISGWQRIAGDADTSEVTARYLLYVNPLRGALYQVIRYRMWPISGSVGGTWLGSQPLREAGVERAPGPRPSALLRARGRRSCGGSLARAGLRQPRAPLGNGPW